MSRLLVRIAIGAAVTSTLLAGCGPEGTSGTGGGGTGGTMSTGGQTTGGTMSTGGASTGGQTTGGAGGSGGASAFGDWRSSWVASWPSTLGDDASIGELGPNGATVAGWFQGTITFPDRQATAPNGGREGYVVQIGPTGQIQWSLILESTYSVWVSALGVADDGKIVVAGRFQESLTVGGQTYPASQGVVRAFVTLLDADAKVLWTRTFGGDPGGTGVFGAGFAPDGAVWIAGEYSNGFDLDGTTLSMAGSGDVFAAKLAAADGKAAWIRGYGGTDVELLFNASMGSTGDIFLSGVYAGDTVFDNLSLPTGPADGLGYLVKLSGADGTATFARDVGAALGYVTASPDGFYFAGTLDGTADFGGGDVTTPADLPVVAAYTPNGDLRWSRVYGDADALAPSIALPDASSAGVAAGWSITGTFDFGDPNGPETIMGGADILLGAVPPDNASSRIRHYGQSNIQSPNSISLGKDGGALVVGYFSGDFDVGPVDSGSSSLASTGTTDTFVLYLAPN